MKNYRKDHILLCFTTSYYFYCFLQFFTYIENKKKLNEK